jgi:cation diffusion facilitator CzcD-associated flavoprotein CzcO
MTASGSHSSESVAIRARAASERRARRADAVVVGAGPYGLATAAHLTERGLSVRTLGEPMESWRQRMPLGMHLKSTPFASSIAAPRPGSTLADFCVATGREPFVGHRPVPVEPFIRYGLWFKDRHVPDVEPLKAVHVARHGGQFAVMLDNGDEFVTSGVVIATGLSDAANLPPQLAGLRSVSSPESGLVSHSSDHRDLSAFAGRRVAVLGAGQSALEGAAILQESGASVELFVRGPRVRFGSPPADVTRQGVGTPLKPESLLGPGWSLFAFSRLPSTFRLLPARLRLQLVATVLGPSGAWWLRERVDGRLAIHLDYRLERAASEGDEVALTFATATGERRTAKFDHIIAATGFRVDVDAMRFLSPALRRSVARTDSTWPALGSWFDSSVPGLYFTGLAAAATYGPVMRFVCGTGFAARRLSAAVARRVRVATGP